MDIDHCLQQAYPAFYIFHGTKRRQIGAPVHQQEKRICFARDEQQVCRRVDDGTDPLEIL